MKDIFKPIRGDYCTSCNTPRSIECYTKFDKPINYTYFLDQLEKNRVNVLDNLDNVQIEYMVCKKCKTEYFIDWRQGYPLPIRDFILVDIFLECIYN